MTTNQKRQRLSNDNLNLNINDDTLNMISNEKTLGVFVDDNLTWSHHVKHLPKKILQASGFYQKLRSS